MCVYVCERRRGGKGEGGRKREREGEESYSHLFEKRFLCDCLEVQRWLYIKQLQFVGDVSVRWDIWWPEN